MSERTNEKKKIERIEEHKYERQNKNSSSGRSNEWMIDWMTFYGYRGFCSFMITRLNEIYAGQETM